MLRSFDSDFERSELPIAFTPPTPTSAPIILNRGYNEDRKIQICDQSERVPTSFDLLVGESPHIVFFLLLHVIYVYVLLVIFDWLKRLITELYFYYFIRPALNRLLNTTLIYSDSGSCSDSDKSNLKSPVPTPIPVNSAP